MTTLIFEPSVTGHHLEYLHHYYEGALKRSDEKYFFVVNRKFEEVKTNFEWQKADNVSFRYIDGKYDKQLSAKNPYVLGWNTSKVLRDYVKEIHPDRVLLTMLMQFLPFISFLLPSTVRVKGVMYKIYLYEQDKMSWIRLLAERIRFWIAVKSKIIQYVYVLNDEDSAKEFNKVYKTDKFRFLPDPIPCVDMSKCKDIRTDLCIPKSHKIYLHYGGLDKRKGTLDILKAIQISTKEELSNMTFIFAGKQKEDLKEQFYPLLEQVKNKTNILVYDEFCSYEFLYNLCFSCDVVLMPYYLTNLSSGCMGYASLFHKPVIGPSKGLIGNLIRKYRLGISLKEITPMAIKSSFSRVADYKESDYVAINQKQNFINSIMR